MRRNMHKYFIIMLSLFIFACGTDSNVSDKASSINGTEIVYDSVVADETPQEEAPGEEAPGVENESGGNSEGEGQVVHNGIIDSNILLIDGTINIAMDADGNIQLGDSLVNVNDLNGMIGIFEYIGEIEIPVAVSTIIIDGVTYIRISPAVGQFNVSTPYVLVIEWNENHYYAQLEFSADNLANEDSMFSDAYIGSIGDTMNGNYLYDEQSNSLIFGYFFGAPFTFYVTGIPATITMYLTAYGVHVGAEDQVIHRRWRSAPSGYERGDAVVKHPWRNYWYVGVLDRNEFLQDMPFYATYMVMILEDGDGNNVTEQYKGYINIRLY